MALAWFSLVPPFPTDMGESISCWERTRPCAFPIGRGTKGKINKKKEVGLLSIVSAPTPKCELEHLPSNLILFEVFLLNFFKRVIWKKQISQAAITCHMETLCFWFRTFAFIFLWIKEVRGKPNHESSE